MPTVIARVRRHQDALFAAFLALLVGTLGIHTLDRFFFGDDTAVLAHLLKHSLREIFFVPGIWQELSTANLTPWISLSFYVDYLLAGANSYVFHVHHLLALWLVAVITTRLLMLFAERWLVWTGVILFLLGTPVLHVSDQLFTRHYLEGLLLSLVALYGFLQCQRGGKFAWEVTAVVCYALAMTAKEIYVPLAVLLVFVATGSVAQRLRQVAPYFGVLALYLVWRGYMLSGHVGGYAPGSTYLDPAFWKNVVISFAGIPRLLFGDAALFVSTVLLSVIAAGLLVQPRNLLLAAVAAALVFLPLVPLVAYPGLNGGDRYVFLPWFLICFGFVVQGQALLIFLRSRPVNRQAWLATAPAVATIVLCTGVAFNLIAQRRHIQQSEVPYYAAVDAQMRYVWNNDGSTAFIPDASLAPSFGMARALGEIKSLSNPGASKPKAVLDPRALDASLPVYAYDAGCRCMQDISATIPARAAQLHQVQRHAPLSLQVTNHDGWIAWDFGPYDKGAYNVISDYVGNLPLPATQNGLRTNIRKDLEITLSYTAPEGWVTYSPPLLLKPDGEVLAWSRE